MKTSDHLSLGQTYTRQELRELFNIIDATINNGVFHPRGHESIWLFITEKKTADRTQYIDFLDKNKLVWDGQTSGRTDNEIIEHELNGNELVIFYRKEKYEFEHAAFRYEGKFKYISHEGANPSHFILERV